MAIIEIVRMVLSDTTRMDAQNDGNPDYVSDGTKLTDVRPSVGSVKVRPETKRQPAYLVVYCASPNQVAIVCFL